MLRVLLFLLAAPVASAQGRLAFEASEHDFGRLPETGEGVHVFRFTNAGDQPLQLSDVQAACGCTTPAWTAAPVAPGASGEVTVAFDPTGRPGPFEKAVFVQADGAASVTLRISGVVESVLAETGVRLGAFAFDRVRLDLGSIRAGEEVQGAFRYANVGRRPVRVDSVSAPAGVRVVVPRRPVFPDDMAGLFVTVDDMPAGHHGIGHAFEIDVVLHTDDAAMPDKALRIVGVQRPQVRMEAGQVDRPDE